jgi:hypothetical protein
VSIGRSPSGEDRSVPADMLLMAGSAIVNEAILTGESTPQWKVFLYRSTLPLISSIQQVLFLIWSVALLFCAILKLHDFFSYKRCMHSCTLL